MTEQDQLEPGKTSELAMKAYRSKNYAEAARLFGLAAEEFSMASDALNAAEMKNNQSVAFLQAGNAAESHSVVVGTDKIFAEAGDRKRQAMALANMGAALADLKKTDDAIKVYEESSEILKDLGEKELRTDVQRSISALRVKKGQFTDAVMEMQEGIMGTETLTLKQRILKKLLFMRLWK